jgi:hypothetical protein
MGVKKKQRKITKFRGELYFVPTVDKVIATAESQRTVTINGCKEPKHTAGQEIYCNTFAQAKRRVVSECKDKIKVAENRLRKLRERLEIAESLKEPE